jgi:hypothetical protein
VSAVGFTPRTLDHLLTILHYAHGATVWLICNRNHFLLQLLSFEEFRHGFNRFILKLLGGIHLSFLFHGESFDCYTEQNRREF